MTKQLSLSQQIHLLMAALETISPQVATPDKLAEVLKWIKDLPPATRPPGLLQAVSRAFGKPVADLEAEIGGGRVKLEDIDPILPRTGWLADYMEYTRQTEPPSAFHFFAGCVTLGASLARNVYFRKGSYDVFPNMCVVFLAPSGVCRKTSAANVGVGLLRKLGGTIIQDKITPEAMVEALRERDAATGLLYAPELAVFIGKQKYMEGMIPMLTALFDAPAEWDSATVMRGGAKLSNVALSFLGCSTVDWLQTAIPRDAFGGGFMSRLLFIVQESTPRSFPFPPPMSDELRSRLLKRLLEVTRYRAEFKIDAEAYAWYTSWYEALRARNNDQKHYAGYAQRKPDHIIRLAMILAVADKRDPVLTLPLLKQALAIVDWVEARLPDTFDAMDTSETGEANLRVLQQLKKRSGAADMPTLLRLNARRMNAVQLKNVLETLRTAKLIEYDVATKTYYLTAEGWK